MKKILAISVIAMMFACSNEQTSQDDSSKSTDKHSEATASYSFGKIEKSSLMPVSDAINLLETSNDTSIQLTTRSTVSGVCEMMGCWMSIPVDKDQEVRITFSDIKQVVPKDIVGDSVYISGTLKKNELSVDMRRHLLMDKGFSEEEAATLVTTDTIEYALIANAVEILHK